jgi:spore germination protein YaaH
MFKRLLAIPAAILFVINIAAQTIPAERISIHEDQSIIHSAYRPSGDTKFSDLSYPSSLISASKPNRKVLGWHPYWTSSTAYQKYNYDALTHIAYFSYEVDTATGGYLTIHDWNSTPIISYAHQRGTKVLLTVTNFGTSRNTELLSDTVKQHTLLNNIVSLLKSRNGDGVNFDLESVSATQKANLVSFARRAARVIKKQLPAAEISMATPAVDWSSAWDFKNLSVYCDYLIIMGYDYYWKGSSTAGPVAPLEGETYNVSKSANTYLTAGVPPQKLMVGVPWYGYDWPVSSSIRKATSTSNATARVYTAARTIAEDNTRYFDVSTKVPWVPYSVASQWRQLWYDDAESLNLKYAFVNSKDLAGIGIWALGYEGGDPEIWNGIIESFADFDTSETNIIRVWPVPADNNVSVEIFIKEKSKTVITLFDAGGRRRLDILSEEREPGIYTEDFYVSGLETGLYLLSVQIGNKVFVKKIIHTKTP